MVKRSDVRNQCANSSARSVGFTIIELVVVIVVIGILAAIALVSYSGFQARNALVVLQSDIQGAASQLESDKIHRGSYPETAANADGNKGLSASPGTSFEYTYVAASRTYCLTAKSSRAGVPVLSISSTDKTTKEGACPGGEGSGAVLTSANCFRVSGTTITQYYRYESNSSSNPACPRAVVIPATINGVQISTIGSQAMRRNNLTSVVLPDSVTTVASEAFHENEINSVTIPNSVTTLGVGAFRENLLTSVTIPSSMTSIGQEAFRENKITSVTIPNTVTSIGLGAFRENQITSATIAASVASIGSDAFRDNKLTAVAVPTGTTIGSGAFDGGVTVTRY